MTVVESGEYRLEVKTPEEVGLELGSNILSLIDAGAPSEVPIIFGTDDRGLHTVMHQAFMDTVGLTTPDGQEGIVLIGDGAQLVRNAVLGVDLQGKDCHAGWQYSVEVY